MAEEAKYAINEQAVDALEKQITQQIRTLFEIMNRPSRQQVLYAKDKKELK